MLAAGSLESEPDWHFARDDGILACEKGASSCGKTASALAKLVFRKLFRVSLTPNCSAFPPFLDRESILLTSPTGSGKTLAGFLGVFDSLLRELESTGLKPGVHCIYISPLRALAYDIEKNLSGPIAGMGLEKELRVHLRTGDTPASERAKFRRKPSHFLVTTPESWLFCWRRKVTRSISSTPICDRR